MDLDKSSPIVESFCNTENGADESARPQWLMVERDPLTQLIALWEHENFRSNIKVQ